jgi:hypothetical protein
MVKIPRYVICQRRKLVLMRILASFQTVRSLRTTPVRLVVPKCIGNTPNWGLKGDECTQDAPVCDAAGLKMPQGAQSVQFTAWVNQPILYRNFTSC